MGWDSAVSSGKLDLLDSEQLSKLTKVYRMIKGTDYEAIRVRDAKETYEQSNHPSVMVHLQSNWTNISSRHFKRMEETKLEIEKVLKEPWLNR